MSTQRLNQDDDPKTESIKITEAADLLNVSVATVRNWVKAGKLHPLTTRHKTTFFRREEIQRLKEEIASGRWLRLNQRRNKQAVDGHHIPGEYVRSKAYLSLTSRLLGLVQTAPEPPEPKLILLEIALNLLYHQGRITLPALPDEQSLTELFRAGQLETHGYGPLLRELGDENLTLSPGKREVLRSISRLEIPFIPGDDLLGLVHLSLLNLGKRKKRGSYYTPAAIVTQLVEESLPLVKASCPKVVDPCCGSGQFLITLFLALRERLIKEGLHLEEAERLIVQNLIGYDLDATALTLAKLNLALLQKSSPSLVPHFQLKQKNTLEERPSQGGSGFDLVIGNPPWGSHFTQREAQGHKDRFTSATTSLESFALFVEYGLDALREGGLLAYVLPEALLNVGQHREVRRLILEKGRIHSIRLLGSPFSHVYAPAITLTVEKGGEKKEPLIVGSPHQKGTYTVSQQRFWNNEAYIFNVEAADPEEKLLNKMKNLTGALFLKGQARFALGIVTGNNKAFLRETPFPGGEPVLRGSDLFKYGLRPPSQYLRFEPARFQQVAPESVYRSPEKLLYRFINKQLVFAYDNRQFLSLNSANILIPQLPGYSVKYVLAILNSRPAQFFHTFSFSSVKVLRQHLEAIPLPPCDKRQEERLVRKVDLLLEEKEEKRRLQLYEAIDALIMELYRLTPDEIKLIRSHFPQVKYLNEMPPGPASGR